MSPFIRGGRGRELTRAEEAEGGRGARADPSRVGLEAERCSEHGEPRREGAGSPG